MQWEEPMSPLAVARMWGVEQIGASVEISWQSLLVFDEWWSIVAMGDGRIMELERANLS